MRTACDLRRTGTRGVRVASGRGREGTRGVRVASGWGREGTRGSCERPACGAGSHGASETGCPVKPGSLLSGAQASVGRIVAP